MPRTRKIEAVIEDVTEPEVVEEIITEEIEDTPKKNGGRKKKSE